MRFSELKAKIVPVEITVDGAKIPFTMIKPIPTSVFSEIDMKEVEKNKGDIKKMFPLISTIISKIFKDNDGNAPAIEDVTEMRFDIWTQFAALIEWPKKVDDNLFFRNPAGNN
jgi:hypothetical protein